MLHFDSNMKSILRPCHWYHFYIFWKENECIIRVSGRLSINFHNQLEWLQCNVLSKHTQKFSLTNTRRNLFTFIRFLDGHCLYQPPPHIARKCSAGQVSQTYLQRFQRIWPETCEIFFFLFLTSLSCLSVLLHQLPLFVR